MNPSNEFWFFFGAALAAQDGSPRDLQGARDGIDEAIAAISDCTENQFLNFVLLHLRAYNEFREAVCQAAIDLYDDLTFTPAAEWEAAFDAEQI